MKKNPNTLIARIYGVYKFHFKEENLIHRIMLMENPSRVNKQLVKFEVDIKDIHDILESNTVESQNVQDFLDILHEDIQKDESTCQKLVN